MRYPMKCKSASEGGFILSFPDFPEAHSEAETKDDAIRYGTDCLETAIYFRVKYGEPLPDPSPLRRGQIAIATTVGFDAKLLLLQTIRAQNVRARDLAARLGITPQEVTRLIDLRHRTKIDAIAAALQALGKRLELSLAA